MSTDDPQGDGYAGISYEPPHAGSGAEPAVSPEQLSIPSVPVVPAVSSEATFVAPSVESVLEPAGVPATAMPVAAVPSDIFSPRPVATPADASPAATALIDSAERPGADSGADDSDSDGGDDDDDDDSPSTARDLLEWAAVLVAAVALALVFKAFLFQAFWIPSESMESTLQLQDRVLVNKVSYRLHDINRGDVVVFRRPDPDPDDEVKDLIKRVVGTPGEVVEGRDGAIYIDGDRLIEPYLDVGVASTSFDFGPLTVGEEMIFVMGDNRERSYDSRYFGTVPIDDVKGRAFVLFWPLNRLGGL